MVHIIDVSRRTLSTPFDSFCSSPGIVASKSLPRPQFASPRHLRRLSHRHGSLEQGKTPLGRLGYRVPDSGIRTHDDRPPDRGRRSLTPPRTARCAIGAILARRRLFCSKDEVFYLGSREEVLRAHGQYEGGGASACSSGSLQLGGVRGRGRCAGAAAAAGTGGRTGGTRSSKDDLPKFITTMHPLSS